MKRRDALKNFGLLSAGLLAAPRRLRAQQPAVPDLAAVAPTTTLPAVTFHNLETPEPLEGGGWRLNRVPATLRPHLNESAQRRAWSPAGAEVRFNLEGPEARVLLRKVETRGPATRHLPVLAEVHYGDFLIGWAVVGDDWTEIVVRQPENAELLAQAAATGPGRFSTGLVRLALPCLPDIQFGGIAGEVSPARAGQVPPRRYLAYGSSITNGATAVRPGDLYPARVARALGVDHFNVGFGGGAHLEPQMADWIAARTDWDFATLELGINLVSRFSVDAFAARVAGFLPRIVAAHPDKWIFVIDLFATGRDLAGDPRHPAFRRVVREAVAKLGVPRVVHCDGLKLLSRQTGHTLDLLHPSSDGFEEIAARLVQIMRPALGQQPLLSVRSG